jgi:hypothetical protein
MFAYKRAVPTTRVCTVSFTDSEGITHAVEITATSLFEAAALGLAEFRRCGFAEAMFGLGTKLTVRVRGPEMSHTVSVGRLKSWLDGSGKSPGEHAIRSRLRACVVARSSGPLSSVNNSDPCALLATGNHAERFIIAIMPVRRAFSIPPYSDVSGSDGRSRNSSLPS